MHLSICLHSKNSKTTWGLLYYFLLDLRLLLHVSVLFGLRSLLISSHFHERDEHIASHRRILQVPFVLLWPCCTMAPETTFSGFQTTLHVHTEWAYGTARNLNRNGRSYLTLCRPAMKAVVKTARGCEEFWAYRTTVVNQTDGPVTSRLLKKKPVFCRVWPSHASHLSFLTEFDWVKHVLVNYDWDLGHKVDLIRNVALSHF